MELERRKRVIVLKMGQLDTNERYDILKDMTLAVADNRSFCCMIKTFFLRLIMFRRFRK